MSEGVVHFNAAGAGLMPPSVVAAIKNHIDLEARRSAHWAMAAAKPQLDETRNLAAALFGVAPAQLAFGETASRMWALAFASLPLSPGQRILVARNDWNGNILNILQRAASQNVEVVQLPTTPKGFIDVEASRALIDERTAVICVSAVAHSSGLPQPIEALGALPRPKSCLYFVDAAQALGQMPLTMTSASADVMVAPARKWLCGGRGQAMAAFSARALERLGPPALVDQNSVIWQSRNSFFFADDARRFEVWEFSAAGRLGLGAALLHLQGSGGVAAVRMAIAKRLTQLYGHLSAIDGLEIFEREHLDQAAFLTFRHDKVPADKIMTALVQQNIAIAAIAYEQAPWEFEARGLMKIGRLSPHIYTKDEDVEQLIKAFREACGG